MKNLIQNIIDGNNLDAIFNETLNRIYENGPISITDMEILSYFKIYQEPFFNSHLDTIINYLAVFYKDSEPKTLRELVFKQYKDYIKEKYDISYTPVQANIASNISLYRCFSFSAPTSTGKSFVFLQEIENSQKDVVVVVPSRALINEYYLNLCRNIPDKTVNILTFVDKINTTIARRNIFVVTPERCRELFRQKDDFSVDLFLFDEAQLSDENSKRGLYYDSIIRRCQKAYPAAKFVFAHPFVKNPESQINKNHFEKETALAKNYTQKTVGQIFMQIGRVGEFYHFGINPKIMGKNRIQTTYDPILTTIQKGGTVLFYVSKSKILHKRFLTEFEKYIDLCKDINDDLVNDYIERLKQYIGGEIIANKNYYSQLIALLKKGIVIHHGSLPLHMRCIVEEYTKKGYCRICFATSTLEQGINMPFDAVFIDRMDYTHHLAIKNLIGRAGRSTREHKFDVGYVIINAGAQIDKFRKIIMNDIILDDVSLLEKDDDLGDDYAGFKEAIVNGTFSDEYNLTPKEIESLEKQDSMEIITELLSCAFINGELISLQQIMEDERCNNRLYSTFQELYETYLHRELTLAEQDVLNSAIKISLWRVHGKTLKNICWNRYAYVSQTKLREDYERRGWNTNNIKVKYLTGYHDLPDKNLKQFALFDKDEKAKNVDYDLIVYDTYDYIDKLIGFKLADIYYAALSKYYEKTNDERAMRLAKYIRYGTDCERYIWMLRYGMSFEDINILDEHIETIDESKITFKDSIYEVASIDKMSVQRFIPER